MRALAYQSTKEFVAVIVFTICNSRLGVVDTTATPLILYAILSAMAFPFMSPYLFVFLRLGPWLGSQGTKQIWIQRFTQVFCVVCSQVIGAVIAAFFRSHLMNTYGYEGSETPSGGLSLYLTKACNDTGVKYDDYTPGYPYFALNPSNTTDAQCFNGQLSSRRQTWWACEEVATVFLFMAGLIHIMEATCPGVLINRFWHADAPPDSFSKDKYIPIPIVFIFYVCVLFAGILKAFPTSHGAFQVSVYLSVLEDIQFKNTGVLVHQNETMWRMIGGTLGTLLALLYYHAVYTAFGRADVKTTLDLSYFFRAKPPEPPAARPITFKREAHNNMMMLDIKSF
jgi:hypothetical protein